MNFDGITKLAVAIVGVAIVAVLVSKNAQTSQLFTSAGGAFAKVLQAATGPVTGSSGLGSNSLGGFNTSMLGGLSQQILTGSSFL